MHEGVLSFFQEWETYYLIIGAAAGALTGLQFVVLTLITEAGVLRGSEEALSAFGSPNVVHFCAALLISAIVSAPWHHFGPPTWMLTLSGIAGLIYSLGVLRRARRQRDYRPVLEDWIWHAVLPTLAYAGLVGAGFALSSGPVGSLYVVGGSALLLVFIGVHNAWDTVAYVVLERTRAERNRPGVRETEAPKPREASTGGSEPGGGDP